MENANSILDFKLWPRYLLKSSWEGWNINIIENCAKRIHPYRKRSTDTHAHTIYGWLSTHTPHHTHILTGCYDWSLVCWFTSAVCSVEKRKEGSVTKNRKWISGTHRDDWPGYRVVWCCSVPVNCYYTYAERMAVHPRSYFGYYYFKIKSRKPINKLLKWWLKRTSSGTEKPQTDSIINMIFISSK
jgi:hypothetical protein